MNSKFKTCLSQMSFALEGDADDLRQVSRTRSGVIYTSGSASRLLQAHAIMIASRNPKSQLKNSHSDPTGTFSLQAA